MGEGERMRDKHWSVASCTPPKGDLTRNPGMCPDWEGSQWPFGLLSSSRSTEPHQPGLDLWFLLSAFRSFQQTSFVHILLCWHLSFFFSNCKWHCIFNLGFHMLIPNILNWSFYVYLVSCQFGKLSLLPLKFPLWSKDVFSFWVCLELFLLSFCWFLLWLCCGWRTHSVWLQFF